MKQKSNKKTSRRNFLKSSITVAAGTVLGGSLLASFTKGETKEAVRRQNYLHLTSIGGSG